ncbi:MAG TPA: helix-turn-helix domain-containing protein, partial [Spirochaetia bacterium]|nr:helix-turn-helix domain-containing protein [Spirochaetia bacterium]
MSNGNVGRADSRMVRQINLHSVFTLIRQQKQLRISDIARRSGLSVATVKNLLEHLIELRLITALGEGNSTGGRKPVIYTLDKAQTRLWSIEIQIDRVIGSVVDIDGNLIWHVERLISAVTVDDVVNLTESIFHDGMCQTGIVASSVLGMTVCIPGFVDLTEKTIVLDVILGIEHLELGTIL